MRYDIPTPDYEVLGSNWRFDDETYDGRKGETSYRGGLGQLSDGVVGLADVRKVKLFELHTADQLNESARTGSIEPRYQN